MSLMDIAPPEVMVRHFDIRGGSLDVQGIKNRDWVALLRRFPELRASMNGEHPSEDTILTAVDGLVPAIIAAGLGVCGDKETEALIVERLAEFEQINVFSAIMELTAPAPATAPVGGTADPLLVSPAKNGQIPDGKVEPPTMNSQQPSSL